MTEPEGVQFIISADDRINAIRLIAAANTHDLLQLISVARDISKGQVPFMVLVALAEVAATFARQLDGDETSAQLAAAITTLTARKEAEAAGGDGEGAAGPD